MMKKEKITLNEVAEQLIEKIKELVNQNEMGIVIAIDGRCASGKTTFAELVQKKIPCNIIHMDHFFLRPEQRTESRYLTAGGNLDYERFLTEVAPQLKKDKDISYLPFDCMTKSFGTPVLQTKQKVTIVEGAYSCHPQLFSLYDYHCFLTVDEDIQKIRILQRNGRDRADMFYRKWIPLEEKYFQTFGIRENCEAAIDMTHVIK